jgi:cell division protein FtsW (lipid II flippase)
MEILIHTHSGLRWILFVLLILSIVYAYRAKSKPHIPDKKKINIPLYTMILFTLQFVVGLILYFTSPKVHFESGVMGDSLLRFYTVEHILGMVIAWVLVHLGYLRSRKQEYARSYRTIFIYYLIAFVLVLISIPWPFRNLGAGWF